MGLEKWRIKGNYEISERTRIERSSSAQHFEECVWKRANGIVKLAGDGPVTVEMLNKA